MPLLGATGGGSAKGFGALANLGYFIRNSLRFRGSNSAYLSRTPASAGNRQIWTWSGWIKRGTLGGASNVLFNCYNTASTTQTSIQFENDTFVVFSNDSSTVNINLVSTQVFRDPSAWYHFVIAFDTTQATSSNRVKIYVNGSQITAFSTATYPSLNYNGHINTTSLHTTFATRTPSGLTDGYLAENHFIDGQALTPSSFGKTDAATGQWIPKKYAGTYGTNGFYLKFADASAATAAAIGKDSSGNGNNWTPNNISVTSGVTYDAMTDSPTLSSAASNYCTINPLLDLQTYATYSEGNLKVSTTAAAGFSMRQQSKGTMAIPSSGKWYFAANASDCGIAMANDDPNRTQYGASILTTNVRYQSSGDVLLNNNSYATVASFTSTDEVGLAIDMDALTVGVYKNGSLLTTVTGVTSGFTYYPMTVGNSSSTAYTAFWNFGQRPFEYTPPSGYKTLNTFNLP
jgi:hypothetical protein